MACGPISSRMARSGRRSAALLNSTWLRKLFTCSRIQCGLVEARKSDDVALKTLHEPEGETHQGQGCCAKCCVHMATSSILARRCPDACTEPAAACCSTLAYRQTCVLRMFAEGRMSMPQRMKTAPGMLHSPGIRQCPVPAMWRTFCRSRAWDLAGPRPLATQAMVDNHKNCKSWPVDDM